MSGFTESVVEQAALVWFESVGWRVRNGDEIAPGTVQPSYKLVVLCHARTATEPQQGQR